jgi:DNA-binding transcriptional regulator YhcF (GntR family)
MENEIEDPVDASREAINDFLKAVEAQNFVQAERQFDSLVTARLNDTLDQARVKIASSVFNDESQEDDEEEVDISDEEIEDALEELEDEEDDDDDEEEDEE